MLQAPLQKDLRWNILKYCMHCTWLKTLNMLTVNVQPNLVGPGLGMRKVDQILLQLTNPESWHAEIILHMFHVWNQETHGYPRDTGSSPWIIGWTWEDQTSSSWQSEWEGHPCFYMFLCLNFIWYVSFALFHAACSPAHMYCGMRTLRCGTHHTHTCLQDLLVRREEQLRLQKKAKGSGPEDVNVSKSACSSDDRSTRKTEGETPTENVEKAS